MLKNFCFCPSQYCSTTSQTSFNYQTLTGAAASSLQRRRHLDRTSTYLTSGGLDDEKFDRFKNSRAARFTLESCSSSCRSNSIDAGDDSGGGAFTFLSTSTTATTTTAAAAATSATNNSIHFYHPKSIQTNSSTSSSSTTSCSRTNPDDDSQQQGNSNNNTKKQQGDNLACKGLTSNLTPLSESSTRVQRATTQQQQKNTTNVNNKENRSTSSRGGVVTTSRLITSTAVINLKPTPPITQPPSLDGKQEKSFRF